MSIQIREMRPEDANAKGFVHHKTWEETYTRLMDAQYIRSQTLERCQEIARRWPENTLVVELNGTIIGFSCYGRQDDQGEVIAIYLLKEVQGLGIGRQLMDFTMTYLRGCTEISLWVLEGNDHAIGFYTHYGFHLDGTYQDTRVGRKLRMVYSRNGACL